MPMKCRLMIFATLMTLLTVCVSFLGDTGFAHSLRDFIAYSPCVPFIRKQLMVLGSVIMAIAFIYGVISRLRHVEGLVVMSDKSALLFLLIIMIDTPLLCWGLAAITFCDFWQLQQSVCCIALIEGIVIAVRTKHYRYVLYYFILFLLFGGIAPAT